MSTVGQFVQEAIDLTNSGSNRQAFVPTARAIEQTIKKKGEESSHFAIETFIKEHWPLITFMGMPRSLPLPMNIPFAFKRIEPRFNVHHGAIEIVSLAVNNTLDQNQLPAVFGINSSGQFEIKGGKMLLPNGTMCGLLGSVIFHPLNTGEAINDESWISISDFKMFVSELFGRKDLAERIMKFYLG
jgi:hypothetical protein